MKLVEMKCQNCGAVLQVEPGTVDIHCDHCKSNYKLDDEAHHIKYDDMEKAGYDYEKGRLKARQEHEEEKAQQKLAAEEAAAKAERDKKMSTWIILAWIFFFPFMLTYWIWVKSKLDQRSKIIVTIILWVFFFIVAAIGRTGDANKPASTNENQTNQQTTENIKESSQLQKCTIMEAADIINTNGMAKDDAFTKAKQTCKEWLESWGEEEFNQLAELDWKSRKNETIEGKSLESYLESQE